MSKTTKITREQIIMLATLRNQYTGHIEKDDADRIRLPKTATDDELRAALDAALTRDFESDFDGKGLADAPKEVIVYMTDTLGLDSEDENAEEETLDTGDDDEEEITDEDDDDADEPTLDDEDDESTLDDDDEPTLDDDDTPEPELDDEPEAVEVVVEVEPARPAPTSGTKLAALSPPTGNSIEDLLRKILEALVNGREIIIRDRITADDDDARVAPRSQMDVSKAPAKSAPPAPVKEPKAPKNGDKAYITAAYNAARSTLKKDAAFSKPAMKVALAKVLKAQPKGKRGRPIEQLGDRGVMSVLLGRITELAAVQAKGTPNASANDARAWATETLKSARTKAIEAAKARKAANATKK